MNAPTAFPDQKPVPPYKHTPLFPLGADTTPYRKITTEGVRVEKALGKDMLVVSREALRALSEAAFGDINHYLRPGHLQQLRNILDDKEASDNDKFVAFDFLKTPISPPAACCRCARIPAPPSSWARRGFASSPMATTRPRSPKARATPICAATCAIRRSRRCRCMRKRTPPTTCRRSARSMPRAMTPTSSCSWPRAAAAPTRVFCSRPRPRC